jgi:hypothetical protein
VKADDDRRLATFRAALGFLRLPATGSRRPDCDLQHDLAPRSCGAREK